MREYNRCINNEGVSDLEGVEVGIQGVADENSPWVKNAEKLFLNIL